MRKPLKPGISFYRMDSGHILNKKIRLLFNEFDSDGYYIWSCLLDYGYDKWGYYFDTNDEDTMELFASEYCKKKAALIKEVIAGCIRRALFDKGVFVLSGILTCQMMQETFLFATNDRRQKKTVFEMRSDLLLLDFSKEHPPNISIVPPNRKKGPPKNEDVPPNFSQTKQDNTKQDKRIVEGSPQFGDQNLIYDVEKELANNQLVFEKICMAAQKKSDIAIAALHKYHLYLQRENGYPKTRKQLYSGFELWLLNEKDGPTHQQNSTGSGKGKPGTSEARVQAARDY